MSTSPTCIRELDAQFGLNIAGQLFDAIEKRTAATRDAAATVPVSGRPARRHPVVFADRARRARARAHVRIRKTGTEPAVAGCDPRAVGIRRKTDKADFLAQANNSGGGESDKAVRPSELVSSPIVQARIRRRAAADAGTRAETAAANATRIAHAAEIDSSSCRPNTKSQNSRRCHNRPRAMCWRRSWRWRSSRRKMQQESQAYAKRPKKKYISANTKEYALRRATCRRGSARVERIGNLNYPDEARREQLHGELVLTVALRRDGTIKSVDVIRAQRTQNARRLRPSASSTSLHRSRRFRRKTA